MISMPSFSACLTVGDLVGDHLWQSTLFAVAVGFLTLAFRNNRAEVRNKLWFAASVKFLIPFATLTAIGSRFSWRQAGPLAQNPAPFVIDMDTMTQPFSRFAGGTPSAVVSHSMTSMVPVVLLSMWLFGCAAILLTWWTCWRRVALAVRKASPVQHGHELNALRRLEVIVGIRKPVALVLSSTSLEPGVFGIARPVLLWPRSLAEHLTDTQAEAILAHELSHVRRRDNLAAAIHMVVETIFWFHPLVWWLGARMVDERERACDEDVLRLGGKAEAYAESVLKVCEFYLEPPIVCVAGVTGSNLKKRMERIMSNHVGETLNGWRKLFLATAGVAVLAIPIFAGALTTAQQQAQPSAHLAFAAASIKKNVASATPGFPLQLLPGGRFIATNVPLIAVIATAYDLPFTSTRIAGGPDWIRNQSSRYEIEATAEQGSIAADATAKERNADIRLMLQTLLAERFKMTVHREIKQMPVYAITVQKDGPKLANAAVSEKDCANRPSNFGDRSSDSCHSLGGGQGQGMHGQAASISDIAQLVEGYSDRPVLDKTNLQGLYKIDTEGWVPLRPRPPRPDGQPPTQEDLAFADPARPTIFQIFDRLGLKLQPETGPAEVIVIDHIEEPTPN